jgi:hypothetical protein
MATKIIGKIVLYDYLDKAKMDALLLSGDLIVFEIQRQFDYGTVPNNLVAVLPTQFDDVNIDYMTALKDVIDVSSWIHFENAVVYKIKYTVGTKEFDLSASYVRNKKDSSSVMQDIVNGQNLIAVFTTPGLDGAIQTFIDLPYNQAISEPDIAALLAVGIELNLGSTGKLFSIKTQSVPFRVSFIQPASALENYVIDFELQNKTIEI